MKKIRALIVVLALAATGLFYSAGTAWTAQQEKDKSCCTDCCCCAKADKDAKSGTTCCMKHKK